MRSSRGRHGQGISSEAMREARDGLVVYTKDRPFSLPRIAGATFRLLSGLLSDNKTTQSTHVRSSLGHGLLDARSPVLSSLVHDEMFIISTGRMALWCSREQERECSLVQCLSPDQVLPPVSATPSPLGSSFTWTYRGLCERPFPGHAEHKYLLNLVL